MVYLKKSKKLSLALIGLILAFTLMACNADNQEDVEDDQVGTENIEDIDKSETQDDADDDLIEIEEEDDFIEEGQPEDPAGEDIAIDPEVAMINESDYIAKIKLIEKGSDNKEIKVLENIKGSLSNENLPAMGDLELNRAYLVFLKDLDGSIVLTDEDKGLILLEGDNHQIFEKINKEIHGN